MGGLWIWIGLTWYRRRVVGWWMLLATLVVFGASAVFTFARIDIIELYREMGYPEAQIELIRQQGLMTRDLMMWSSAIWIGPVLGYLIWVKRFFRPASVQGG
jgi:hypothetical protein